ncbi:2-C-methyl-D-erythritol 4-phosphate cytidylyltransferase [Amycolatopsis sp. NPDC026612]|uniref:IspD/TarI family cytidylyltransferase n=1 Tax=Amycolatopsis sp. NPDC026612 TaxID=3155466 RepID=UPI0033FA819C
MNVVAIVTVAHHASDGESALTPVHGEALLTHTVRGLLDVPEISSVLVVAPQRCASSFSEAVRGLGSTVVSGSLRQAFAAVEPGLSRDSVVLLHDALRAFIPAHTVRDVISAVRDGAPIAVPVLPMADTVKVTDAASLIVGTEDRSRLRTLQTPIGYTLAAFRSAEPWDVAGAATVPGHPDAMRVTSGFELSLAEAIAAAPKNEETL